VSKVSRPADEQLAHDASSVGAALHAARHQCAVPMPALDLGTVALRWARLAAPGQAPPFSHGRLSQDRGDVIDKTDVFHCVGGDQGAVQILAQLPFLRLCFAPAGVTHQRVIDRQADSLGVRHSLAMQVAGNGERLS